MVQEEKAERQTDISQLASIVETSIKKTILEVDAIKTESSELEKIVSQIHPWVRNQGIL